MTTPTTTTELLEQANTAALARDVDTIEGLFDVLAGWMISDHEKHVLGCVLGTLCGVAQGTDFGAF